MNGAQVRYIDGRDRISRNVRVDAATGCWRWLGTIQANGYGRMVIQSGGSRRSWYAHRLSYEVFVGPIPDGLQIDHLCRIRDCVNPAHLEAVTARENLHRSPVAPAAVNSRKTHCHRRHRLSANNTYLTPGGSRVCRTCQRAHEKASRARKRQAA